MGLDVPMFGMDPDVVTADSNNSEVTGAGATGAEATRAEATGTGATGTGATGAEAASKVSDEVIAAKAVAGEDEHADAADSFPPELGNLKSIGTSGLLESLESEPQRLQSLE